MTLKFNNYFIFLDFLSRIPTIPELKRYQAEIVIKEEPEAGVGKDSDFCFFDSDTLGVLFADPCLKKWLKNLMLI